MPVVTIGGSAGPVTGVTFNDLIEKVYRRVMSGASEMTVLLQGDVGGYTTNLTLSGPQTSALVPGAILAVGLELMLVTASNPSANSVTVIRAYMGSRNIYQHDKSLVYINPSISRYDIGVAINDDMNALSAMGLVRINTAAITYNPVFMGYDLGDLPTNFIEILEVRSKIPFPDRRYPPITRWKVSRYQDTSVFPSGNSLTVYEGGYPGMPIYVTYSAPLLPYYAATDNVFNTPVTNDPDAPYNGYSNIDAIANLPTTAVDIPPLGATIQLIQNREFSRNLFMVQPDPRKATDVPAGAIMNSTQRMEIHREKRIAQEVARIHKQYTRHPQR